MSHALASPAQPRRSKTILSPDGQTAKFLYTILKQLDLKTIDWNEVASQLDITNGHAARMRYSRFKTQIEGLVKEPKYKLNSKSASVRGEVPKFREKTKKDGEGAGKKRRVEDSDGGNVVHSVEAVKRVKIGSDQPRASDGMIKTETRQDMLLGGISDRQHLQLPDGQLPKIHHPIVTTYSVPTLASPLSHYPANPSSGSATDQIRADHSQSAKSPASAQILLHGKSTQPQHRTQSYSTFLPQNQQFGAYTYPSAYPYPQYGAMVSQHQPSYYQHPRQYTQQIQQPQTYHPYQQQSQIQPQPQLRLSSTTPSSNQGTSSERLANQPATQSTSAAYELAAAASYPWPYSEKSIPRYMKAMEAMPANISSTEGISNSATNLDFNFFGEGLGAEFNRWATGGVGHGIEHVTSLMSSSDLVTDHGTGAVVAGAGDIRNVTPSTGSANTNTLMIPSISPPPSQYQSTNLQSAPQTTVPAQNTRPSTQETHTSHNPSTTSMPKIPISSTPNPTTTMSENLFELPQAHNQSRVHPRAGNGAGNPIKRPSNETCAIEIEDSDPVEIVVKTEPGVQIL